MVLQCFWSSHQTQRYDTLGACFDDNGLIFYPVCVLLDVGTKPTGTSIYELWKCRYCGLSVYD